MHKSVATIDNPEFINLEPLDINPLMSKCEIKVMYVGDNRNRSSMSKDVITEMAKTLRGAPIVGYYKEQKEDFADHGEKVVIDDEGVHFECMTVPYGFVAPDAQVWFQKFEDYDDFGNTIIREYLMTTGFLWTGQFEEAKLALEEGGRPHSMELDEKTIKGQWSENYKTGMEFFIINDAIFSKLCILGEDVEPCYEGSSISSPTVSNNFSLDDNFKQTLFSMMEQLKFALEGGQEMHKNNIETASVEEISTVEDKFVESETVEIEEHTEDTSSVIEEGQPSEDVSTTFADDDDEEDDEEETSDTEEEEPSESDDKDNNTEDEPKEEDASDDDDKKKKYALLEEQYAELEAKFQAMEKEYNALLDEKKDALIDSFYTLDEEDKKDVISNKSQYSLEDIKAKLSIIFTEKTMKAQKETEEIEKAAESVVTYSLADSTENLPDWVRKVRETAEKMK